jgi:monoamine oxidase
MITPLKKKRIDVLILEPYPHWWTDRNRAILTEQQWKWATWFSKPHQHLIALYDELNIILQSTHQGISNHVLCASAKFEISDAEEPSYRIVGGTATIEKISCRFGIQNIKTQLK